MENKKNRTAEVLSFLSDIGFGLCLGIVVDQFAGTKFVLTIVGAVLGVGLAFV